LIYKFHRRTPQLWRTKLTCRTKLLGMVKGSSAITKLKVCHSKDVMLSWASKVVMVSFKLCARHKWIIMRKGTTWSKLRKLFNC